MRTVRIYEPQGNLHENMEITLSENGSGHLCRVLRFKEGDLFNIFDGIGHEFKAKLVRSGNKAAAQILETVANSSESPLQIELGQVISRGDKMDLTVQKAVELGIFEITPLTSIRCNVKLDEKRSLKKVDSWQKIAVSACEQSGRSFVPKVNEITDLKTWCSKDREALNLTLDPLSSLRLKDLKPTAAKIRLLIGPEGGLSQDEINDAAESGFIGVSLGPRILRTETAALVALSILGSHFGDL